MAILPYHDHLVEEEKSYTRSQMTQVACWQYLLLLLALLTLLWLVINIIKILYR